MKIVLTPEEMKKVLVAHLEKVLSGKKGTDNITINDNDVIFSPTVNDEGEEGVEAIVDIGDVE